MIIIVNDFQALKAFISLLRVRLTQKIYIKPVQQLLQLLFTCSSNRAAVTGVALKFTMMV